MSDDVGSRRGELAEAGRTDDTTPTLFGTLSAPLNPGESLRVLAGSTTVLGNATVNSADQTWSFTPSTALVSGTYTFVVLVIDSNGNTGPTSAPRSLTVDTIAPAVAISSNASALNAGETATLSFVFSETPVGFTSSAISASSGTISGLAVTTDPKVYTATFTPPAGSSGSAWISVAADSYSDAAGNPGVGGSAAALPYDTQPPSLAISSNAAALIAGQTATITFSFSEAPSGFVAADITATRGTSSGLAMTADPRIWTATFTPTPNSSGTAALTVAAGSYNDAPGNPGGAASLTSLVYDTRPPAGSRIGLYDASRSSLPDAQGWLAFGTGGTGSQSPTGTGTLLTSNATIQDGAGYSNVDRSSGNLVNSSFPALDRSVGFSLDAQLRLVSESHLSSNRAGFSLTLLDLGSTPRGIEIGFWSNSIFSQAGGPTPFQSVAQVANSVDTSSTTNYSLRIFDQSYTLLANNRPVLGGPLQDYSQASLSPLFPFNPYGKANFLFLGDNSSSAAGQVELGGIALGLPLTGSAGADTMTGTAGADRLNGLDGNDRIEAGAGADWLIGGRGDDQLAGGDGDDLLIGGSGLDRFVFGGGSPFNAGALGLDSIVGFEVLEDRIVLARAAFTALGPGPSLDPSSFAVVDNDAAAASSDALITYNAQSGGVFYNPNGSAPGFAASPEGGGKFLQLLANASGNPFPLPASGNLQIL